MKLKKIKSVIGLVTMITLITSFSDKNSNRNMGSKYLSARTDSLEFVSYAEQGWSTLKTYLQAAGDSVIFEVILSKQLTSNVNWHTQLLIGATGSAYRPISTQVVKYNEPLRSWNIIFQPDGKCYLELISGPFPGGNPIIIPIQAKYKKVS